MKKRVILPYVLLLAACNNTGVDKNGHEPDSVASTSAESITATAARAPAGCERLVFFKKGTEIESTTFKGDGRVMQKELSRIVDVATEAGLLVSTVKSTDITGGPAAADPVQYNCKCDGNTFYVDMAPLMGALEANSPAEGGHELAFPVSIQDGQTLPEASVTVDMSLGDKTQKVKMTYSDRKVDGTKNITTAAGSWNCYKITASLSMDMIGLDEKTKKMMEAMKDNMPAMHSVMWYAPDAGIVQFDVYMDGELQSYSQITAIRMQKDE